MECKLCHIELTGSLDTFGDIGEEMCQDCWLEWCEGWWEERFKHRLIDAEIEKDFAEWKDSNGTATD